MSGSDLSTYGFGTGMLGLETFSRRLRRQPARGPPEFLSSDNALTAAPLRLLFFPTWFWVIAELVLEQLSRLSCGFESRFFSSTFISDLSLGFVSFYDIVRSTFSLFGIENDETSHLILVIVVVIVCFMCVKYRNSSDWHFFSVASWIDGAPGPTRRLK